MTDNGNPTSTVDENAKAAVSGPQSIPRTATALPKIRFGEELPLFCERCGYSLNGLPQLRCNECRVLHFSCPECDHHQPINTLRPAMLRALGRLRAIGLALIAFLKINVVGWSLFFWGVGGYAISYSYRYYGGPGGYSMQTTDFEWEGGVILFLFGLLFGMVARMLLLRWSRGVLVGLALAGLVVIAMLFGAHLRQLERREPMPSPIDVGFVMYMAWSFVGTWVGASTVWGFWLALVNAFLPKRAAKALLDWQRAMSQPKPVDATTSVT